MTFFTAAQNVCFWHKADMSVASTDVRLRVNSGHERDDVKCRSNRLACIKSVTKSPLSRAKRVAYPLISCPEDGTCRGLRRVKWAAMLPSVGIHLKSTDALLSPVLLSNSGGDL
jgi:hypothetical protein